MTDFINKYIIYYIQDKNDVFRYSLFVSTTRRTLFIIHFLESHSVCVCVRCAESEFVTSVLPVAHLYLCVHTTARVDYTAVRVYINHSTIIYATATRTTRKGVQERRKGIKF